MPRGKTHRLVGGAAGLVAGTFVAQGDRTPYALATILGGTLAGVVGGALPDILEPATSPNHRRVAHGVGPAVTTLILFLKWWQAQIAHFNAKGQECETRPIDGFDWEQASNKFIAGAMAGLASGYASHLILDATTPRSLPFM